MLHELQPLLSSENQAALVFAAAGEMSDHPPDRVAAYIGGTVGTLSNWRNTGSTVPQRNILMELRLIRFFGVREWTRS